MLQKRPVFTLLVVAVIIAIPVFFSMTYASNVIYDAGRGEASTDTDAKNWVEATFPVTAKQLEAADAAFNSAAQTAFGNAQVANLIGYRSSETDIHAIAKAYIERNPTSSLTEDELVAKLEAAQGFLNRMWNDDTFVETLVKEISSISPGTDTDAKTLARNAFIKQIADLIENIGLGDEVNVGAARNILMNDTRFVTFLFGLNALDANLATIANTADTLDIGALTDHMGTHEYEQGRTRTHYETLAHLVGYAEYENQGDAVKAYQAKLIHEFKDYARGGHEDESLDNANINLMRKINRSIIASSTATVKASRRNPVFIEIAKAEAATADQLYDQVFAVQASSIKGKANDFLKYLEGKAGNEAVVVVALGDDATSAKQEMENIRRDFKQATGLNLEDLVHLEILGKAPIDSVARDSLSAMFNSGIGQNQPFGEIKLGAAIDDHRGVVEAIGGAV